MDRPGHEEVRFFVGTEVEHSPAFGMKTLFVVGIQSVEDILHWAKHQECTHIYFGANQSFPKLDANSPQWKSWESMIVPLLEEAYWCTLDADIACAEGFVEGPLIEYWNFIPMLSVKIPHVRHLGYNATVKIDDVDFRATNHGVWCHSLHSLQTRSSFTPWSDYSKDATIE